MEKKKVVETEFIEEKEVVEPVTTEAAPVEETPKEAEVQEENHDNAYVSLRHIDKVYPNGVQAVFDFNLDVQKEEFIVFVGPSGCGKSTTLRMIAGLEDITSGELYIDGMYANEKAPKDRDIAMVFQSYALYPHMTVFKNMAFSLKIRHTPKEEINRRVHEAAKILQIEEYLNRKPKALSGGQRQRVALGRAIVRNAKVFLMDEPLSNLDAKLRVQMRSEIVRLTNELHATTIYVTHDQTEAMTMATRIVVMNKGKVQQIGTPFEIYNNPVNKFVAGFIGSPSMNFMDVTYKDGVITFSTGEQLTLPKEMIQGKEIPEKVIFGVRPEDVLDSETADGKLLKGQTFDVEIKVAELLGREYFTHSDFGGIDLVGKMPSQTPINNGDKKKIVFRLANVKLFNPETEETI